MKATLQSIHPRLPVTDLKVSLDFYRRLFELEARDIMENEGFAILHKDKIGLQLVTRSSSHPLSPATLWIDVVGVAALYELLKNHFPIEWGPGVYSYGRREFCVGDPDKHRIIFSEVTSDPVTCEG